MFEEFEIESEFPFTKADRNRFRSIKTEKGAARAVYEVVCRHAKSIGLPDKHVYLQDPEESAACGYGENWRVVWEEGPHEWGIAASMVLEFGNGVYAEPYYSFDLCFTR